MKGQVAVVHVLPVLIIVERVKQGVATVVRVTTVVAEQTVMRVAQVPRRVQPMPQVLLRV